MKRNSFAIILCIFFSVLSACRNTSENSVSSLASVDFPVNSVKSASALPESSVPDSSSNTASIEAPVTQTANTTQKPQSSSETNEVTGSKIEKFQSHVEENTTGSVSLPETKNVSPVLNYDENGYAYTYDEYGNKSVVYHQVNGVLDTYTIYYYSDPKKQILDKSEIYSSESSLTSVQHYKNQRVVKNEHYTNECIDTVYNYEYDNNGNQTLYKEVDANGKIIKKVRNKYDTFGNITETTTYTTNDTVSGIQQFVYDEEGNFLEYHEYDSNGVLIF